MHIEAIIAKTFIEAKKRVKDQNYKVTSELTEIDKMGVELESAFLEKYRSGSGYVVRAPDYWVEKLNNHVYKKYYVPPNI